MNGSNESCTISYVSRISLKEQKPKELVLMFALYIMHIKKSYNDITMRKVLKVVRTFATKDALATIPTLKPYKVFHAFVCGPAIKPSPQHS